MKKSIPKTNRNQIHTPKSPKGMGDYYGSGIRQPLGRIRSGFGMDVTTPKELKKPPRSLA